MKPRPADPPFATLIPVRAHRWEDGDDGFVTVFIPRFTGRLTRRWLVPLLARPEVRLRLDATGSFVWRECDGRATVADVARRLQDRFGGDPADAERRVARFVRDLARTSSVTFLAPAGPAAAGAESP